MFTNLSQLSLCDFVPFSWGITPPIQNHLFTISPETSDIQQSLNNAALQLGIAFGTLFGSFIIETRSIAETPHFGIIFVGLSFLATIATVGFRSRSKHITT